MFYFSYFSNFLISTLLPIVSKAFEKSIKTPSINCFSSKELEIRLENCKIACSVECGDLLNVETESQTVFHIKFCKFFT